MHERENPVKLQKKEQTTNRLAGTAQYAAADLLFQWLNSVDNWSERMDCFGRRTEKRFPRQTDWINPQNCDFERSHSACNPLGTGEQLST